jgi:hypothetical protein
MMRRRLGRDKLIGTGLVQIPSATVHNRGLQTVQLIDKRGDIAGQVYICRHASHMAYCCGASFTRKRWHTARK